MHFFIDHNSLPIQDPINTFGVDGNNPMDKFNITSQFLLTAEKVKAFACQDGLMIVQQSLVNSSLVNIILKPVNSLQVPYKSIRYYIYRGVRKDSFINGTAITPQAVNNTETIARIWETWEHYKTTTNQPALADPAPECFGYDNSLAGSLNVRNVYDNSQEVRAIYVQEGEWIGNFGNEFPIGFEIIIEENNTLNIDLDYLRAGKFHIDVTGLTDLELKAKREQVLSFIDPAAFFGIHYDVGVKISTYDGNVKTTETKKRDEIYSFLVSKFATKNTVYLDIRSECGYSYNFYENYGDNLGNNIKVGNSLTMPTAQNYSTNGWPILMINNSFTTANNKNNIKINLRIDDNTKPILFFENTKLISDDNNFRFIEDTKILNGADEWSKDLSFVFPNTENGAVKENIAYYIQLNYFRQEYNPVSPNTVLKNENYFNSAFCPIDLPDLGNVGITFQMVFNSDLNFVIGILPNSNDIFSNVGYNGAFWDNDRVLFYSRSIFPSKMTGKFYPKSNNGNVNKFSLNNKHFDLSFKKDVDIYCKVLQEETGNNQYTPFKSISISRYDDFPNTKECLLLLGIKIDEWQSLMDVADAIDQTTQLSNLSTKHYRYLFLEEDLPSPKTDKDGRLFRKFKLKVQGIAPNGESAIIAPSNDIFLYTRDGFCFTSKEFAEYETDNDVNNLIKFFLLDANNLYKSVKRLSKLTNEIAWQLYNLDGVPKKYDAGEVNYAGDSLTGKKIELPVGTRAIILGESKNQINNFDTNYIVCFHEGTYREGFIDKNAFINSNKDENGTLVRVNKLEGDTYPQLIWKPFLDDAKRIIHYCEKINSLSNVFPPFKNLIIDTRNKFKTLLNTFTPYSNPSSLIAKLQQLNDCIQSKSNNSLKLGNLGCNLENTVDSIERWLAFPPLKEVMTNHIYKVAGVLTNGFKSIVIPIRLKWFEDWDSYLRTIPDIAANLDGIYYYRSDFGGIGATNVEHYTDLFLAIKTIVQKLNAKFNDGVNQPVMDTIEALWIKDLDVNDIVNVPNFIVIGEKTWNIMNEIDYMQYLYAHSFILIDHSIGYIDSIPELSCLIHEINTIHEVKKENNEVYGEKPLYFDTHGAQHANVEFLRIQQILKDKNSVLEYFDIFPPKKTEDGPWLALITNPNTGILYLNYYLTKLLE